APKLWLRERCTACVTLWSARVSPVGTQPKRAKGKKRNGTVRPEKSAETISIFETLLDSLETGVAIVSVRGFVEYSNPCFAGLRGAPPQREMKGSNLRHFVSADSWMALDKALGQSARSSSEGKLQLENAEGGKRTVRVSFVRLGHSGSELRIGMVAT